MGAMKERAVQFSEKDAQELLSAVLMVAESETVEELRQAKEACQRIRLAYTLSRVSKMVRTLKPKMEMPKS